MQGGDLPTRLPGPLPNGRTYISRTFTSPTATTPATSAPVRAS